MPADMRRSRLTILDLARICHSDPQRELPARLRKDPPSSGHPRAVPAPARPARRLLRDQAGLGL
jgi:hypothetical protein